MKRNIFLLLLLFPIGVFSQNIKITYGPYLQNVNEQEATIVWTTDKDAVSWVELAPSGNDSFYAKERQKFYQTSHGSKVVGQLHKITINGLQPGTQYRYRIFSKEILKYEGHRIIYGNIASSDVYQKKPYTFTTLNSNKEKISFKIVNDIHGKNDNLLKMLGNTTKENTDLVIFNGDMVSMLNKEEEIFTGFMHTAVDVFASEVPVFYARGNHETRGKASRKLIDYFPTNNGKYYYAFQHGPVFFIFLDGGEDKPDTDIEYSDLAQFDSYRSEVAAWIEKVAAKPEFASAPFRAVVLHIPPTGSSWHGTQDIASKFLPVLNQAGIDIMFCGHTHNYKFIAKGEDKNINFPVLINDDEMYLDITATKDVISIDIRDMSGKVTTTHRIENKK